MTRSRSWISSDIEVNRESREFRYEATNSIGLCSSLSFLCFSLSFFFLMQGIDILISKCYVRSLMKKIEEVQNSVKEKNTMFVTC